MKNSRTSDLRKLIKFMEKESESDKSLYIDRLKGEITIKVFTDVSFCSLGNKESQKGYVIIIEDENGRRVPVI